MNLICTRLVVSDFPADFQFWRDVMRLPLTYSDEGMGYAYFQAGDVGVELMRRATFFDALGQPDPGAAGTHVVLDIRVDDVDATFAEVVARGAHALTEPTDRPAWMARTAHIRAPSGAIVELYTKL